MATVPHNEVAFLVLHYLKSLDAGNAVVEATNGLERALIDASLLPNVVDYTGASRVLSYAECARNLPHIHPSYLRDALSERIPPSKIPVNTLFAPSNTSNRPSQLVSTKNRRSEYSASAYHHKHSHSLRNIHALLDQMHTLDRPFPLVNIVYSVLPKLMRRLKRVVGHHHHVFCTVYDASGDYIVTGSDDQQLKVWSSRTGYLCHTLRGHEHVIEDISADPSRRIIVSASRDATIRVWDLVTGENTRVLRTGSKSVNCVLFSPCPDRPYLLSGGDDGIARLWNTSNFDQKCLTIQLPPPRSSRRGQTVGTSGVVRRTGSTTGDSFPAPSPPAESLPASSPPRTPSRISSPPPGLRNEIQSAPAHQNVTLASRNVQTNSANSALASVAANSVTPHTNRSIAHGNSGSLGAGPSGSGSSVGNPPNPHVAPTIPLLPSNVPLVQNGPAPGSSGQNNSIVSSSPVSHVLSVAFNTGATKLAISGSDCMTHLYSVTKESVSGALPTVRWITTLRGHSSKITQVLFSHHGDRLCTASADGTARIYRRVNAKAPAKNKRRSTCVPGAGTWKNVVLDCRLQNSEVPSVGRADSNSIAPRVSRPRESSCVEAVMWSLNDEFVISASSDGKVRVWDSDTGRLVHVLNAHTKEVYIMDAHPFDKRVIFTAGYDGKCILWDIEKGVELRRLSTTNGMDDEYENGMHPAVTDGKFSPDGMSFCITDKSGALTMFGIPAGDSMLLAPEEQFFANDTMPFRRDAQHRAISLDTGMPLHLLPKGDLCDSMLQKHPLVIQIHCRDFHQKLPGVKERENQELAVSVKIARGVEFRRHEEKEERRLMRIAIDEKRKAMREKREKQLERDELMASNSMRDFVVPDSDKESDDDFKLEASESEMNTSDDNKYLSEESEELRPKSGRARRKRCRRKRTRKNIARSSRCTCTNHENDHEEENGAESEEDSDGSDESFRVDSDEADSDASGEALRKANRKIVRVASRIGATSGTGTEPKVRTSSSTLPRMKIHMNRSDIDREANRVAGPVNSDDTHRSPGRSFTSEKRADLEDKILPQEPAPPFSRASSSNIPSHRRQWSVQSTANGKPKRRSPRNKGKVEEEETNFDINEISRQEIEDLHRGGKDESGDLPIKRGRRQRRRSSRRAKKARKAVCPLHSFGADSESDVSDDAIPSHKRRKMSNRSMGGVNSDEFKEEHVEWKLLASEWLRGTTEKYNYIPQRGDSVVYYPKGHADAMSKSRAIGVDPKHNSKMTTCSLPRLDGAELQNVIGPLRFIISAVSHEFPVLVSGTSTSTSNKSAHRTVAVLTLKRGQKDDWPTCVPNEVALPYFPLDDVPEYIVLTSRVEMSIAHGWKPGNRFRMLFVNEKRVWSYYSGVVQTISEAMPGLGWNTVQVMYDNDDDPDKGSTDIVSPWELEPIGVSRAGKSLSMTARPSMYLAIANEIHQLQACDELFKSSASWLDTVQRLSANSEYCKKVPLPMDLHIILTRLCTAFYRSFDAFLDDMAMLKENALTYHGENNETVQMADNVYHCVMKVAQRTRLNMTASSTPPIPSVGASVSSRAVRPRTPNFDAAQMGQIGMANGYRPNHHHMNNASFVMQPPPKLPTVGFMAPPNNNYFVPARVHPNGVMQGMARLPSVGTLAPTSAQATLEVVRGSPGRVSSGGNYGISAPLPPVPAVLAHQQHQQQHRNRPPTRSAQSVEAAGGAQATTSESRVPFYQQQQQSRVHMGGMTSYQENSRNEHSIISIAAASTMSCGGENVGESPENRG